MKKCLILLFFICVINVFSQNIDTVIRVKSSWYSRSMPTSLYTGQGLLVDKISSNIEFGRSYGVIDIGIVAGQINQRADSNKYAEARVTMDASQYSIFSNEISIGFGHVFKSKTPIMLEISYTLFAQVYKKWGVGVVTGYYDFSGDNAGANKAFYGLFIRYGLLRDVNGVLNRKMRMHHHR